jgi:hypothetical protein
MTMSWHTMIDFEPPIVGCVVSNRNLTFNILKATKECVINIPPLELTGKVVECGNTSGRKIDKLKTFRLTTAAASKVEAPLNQRLLHQPRVPSRRCQDGREIQLFNPGSNQRLDRLLMQAAANDPSTGKRPVHGRRENDQAAFQDEIETTALAIHPR